MTNRIWFKDFSINPEIIAPRIYSSFDRQISSRWIEINDEVRWELEDFLKAYIEFLWFGDKKAFFRIDSYFDQNRLYILDVNASFVDGWWNAINFTRAVWEEVWEILNWYFPENFFLQEEVYRPEFELSIREIWMQTWENFQEIDEINSMNSTYIYWNLRCWKESENVYPFNWIKNDDKRNLARFSKIWRWDLVKIPVFIMPEDEQDFDKIPDNVVLKIASKRDIDESWRNKVFVWKKSIWKRWVWLWKDWILVAQTLQNPQKNDNWENTQAIILTAWANAIAWYVQNSTRSIINDSSVQSPLIFK